MIGAFGTIFAAVLFTHYLGDYYVQTNHQAVNKGLTGEMSPVGRWNCLKHAAGYTMAQAVVVPLVLQVDGFGLGWEQIGWVWVALVFNGITHYIIDRRWTLEAFARLLGKGGWYDADRPRATLHMDQAAHIILLGWMALVIRGFLG